MNKLKKDKNYNNKNGKYFKKERRNNQKEKEEKPKWHEDLRQETKHSILAVISFVISFVFILTAFNKAGIIGEYVYKLFDFLFGAGFYLLPVLFIALGVSFLISFRFTFLTSLSIKVITF